MCYNINHEHLLYLTDCIAVYYNMKTITVVALALLVIAASACIPFGCSNTENASIAELTKQAKHCYTLEHSAYNMHAFDQYTVKDLQVLSKTTTVLSGSKVTLWSVAAKLYDPNNVYVENIQENMNKTGFGWSCQ